MTVPKGTLMQVWKSANISSSRESNMPKIVHVMKCLFTAEYVEG